MGYFRVIINGNSPFPGEVWSTGLSFEGPNTFLPFADLQAWATNIATAIAALVANPLINILSTAGSITTIRTEQRDESTEALLLAAEADLVSPKIGTGTLSKPLQTSFVISLRSPIPGRSRRGRCYWPAWAYTNTATGKFSDTNTAQWLGGFLDISELIITQAAVVDPGYIMVLAVRSRLLHDFTQVTTLAGGDVPDTQRRRRDDIPELYELLAV